LKVWCKHWPCYCSGVNVMQTVCITLMQTVCTILHSRAD